MPTSFVCSNLERRTLLGTERLQHRCNTSHASDQLVVEIADEIADGIPASRKTMKTTDVERIPW